MACDCREKILDSLEKDCDCREKSWTLWKNIVTAGKFFWTSSNHLEVSPLLKLKTSAAPTHCSPHGRCSRCDRRDSSLTTVSICLAAQCSVTGATAALRRSGIACLRTLSRWVGRCIIITDLGQLLRTCSRQLTAPRLLPAFPGRGRNTGTCRANSCVGSGATGSAGTQRRMPCSRS